jgi:hypothetical protein
MAHRHDSVQVEWIDRRQLGQVRATGRDVWQRARPAAAGLADAAVFDAPRRIASRRERRAQMPDVQLVILRPPEPAVEHDDRRVRPVPSRQSQIAELCLFRPIRNTLVRRRRRPVQDLPFVRDLHSGKEHTPKCEN